MDLFTDYKVPEEQRAPEKLRQKREANMQKAALPYKRNTEEMCRYY